jgi:hypothetical protein
LSVTPFTRAVFSVNPPGILEVLSCVTCLLLFSFFLFLCGSSDPQSERASRGERPVRARKS